MSQAESLRLIAEVVDKATGPLKQIREALRNVQAGPGVVQTRKELESVGSTAKAAGREISTVLTPALAAVGVTGLTASGAILAVGAAIKGFSAATANLAMLSRESGFAVDALRRLEGLGGKVGIEAGAMDASVQKFAENSRLLKKGVGDISTFLFSQNPVIAKWAAKFRKDLNDGLDPEEAYKRALRFMKTIRDPIERGIFAENLFGNRSLSRLATEDIDKLIADVDKALGRLPRDAAKNAIEFHRAMESFSLTMGGIRDAIGADTAPILTDITNSLAKFFQENREPIAKAVSDSVRELAEAFKTLDAKTLADFKDGASAIGGAIGWTFKQAVEFIRDVNRAIKETQDLIKWFGENKVVDLTPGEISENKRKGLEGQVDESRKKGSSLNKLLEKREAEGNTAEADRLRKAIELNSQRLRELEAMLRKSVEGQQKPGDATAQKSSAEEGGQFGGARIYNAAYGGMAAAGGRMRAYGGGAGSQPYMGGLGGLPGMPRGGGGGYGGGYGAEEGGEGAPGAPGGRPRMPRDEGAPARPGGPREAIQRQRQGGGAGDGSDGPGLNADGSIGGLGPEAQEQYANILGKRENGNRYGIRNSYGFSGRWQMGAAALADTGYVRRGTSNRGLADPGNWTGKGGIGSLNDFLRNKDGIQDRQFIEYTNRNRRALERLGVIRPGMSQREIAGWLATAHLKGPGGAAALARGRDNSDANGTRASSYYRMMEGVGRGRGAVAGGRASPGRQGIQSDGRFFDGQHFYKGGPGRWRRDDGQGDGSVDWREGKLKPGENPEGDGQGIGRGDAGSGWKPGWGGNGETPSEVNRVAMRGRTPEMLTDPKDERRESFYDFYNRRGGKAQDGRFTGRRETFAQPNTNPESPRLAELNDRFNQLRKPYWDGDAEDESSGRRFGRQGETNDYNYTPKRKLTLDEIRKFRAPGLPEDGGRGALGDAMKSPVMGGGAGQPVNVQGGVNVNISNPGPNTKVRTETDGELFKEVRLNRGQTMPRASEVA